MKKISIFFLRNSGNLVKNSIFNIIILILCLKSCNVRDVKTRARRGMIRSSTYETAHGESSDSEVKSDDKYLDRIMENSITNTPTLSSVVSISLDEKRFDINNTNSRNINYQNDFKRTVFCYKNKKYIDNAIIVKLKLFFSSKDFARKNNICEGYGIHSCNKMLAEEQIRKFVTMIFNKRLDHIFSLLELDREKVVKILMESLGVPKNIGDIIAEFTCEIKYLSLIDNDLESRYYNFIFKKCSKLEYLARQRIGNKLSEKHITSKNFSKYEFDRQYKELLDNSREVSRNSHFFGKTILSCLRGKNFLGNDFTKVTHLKKIRLKLNKPRFATRCCNISNLDFLKLAFVIMTFIDICIIKFLYNYDIGVANTIVAFELIFLNVPWLICTDFLFGIFLFNDHCKENLKKSEEKIFDISEGYFGRYNPFYPGMKLKSKFCENLDLLTKSYIEAMCKTTSTCCIKVFNFKKLPYEDSDSEVEEELSNAKIEDSSNVETVEFYNN